MDAGAENDHRRSLRQKYVKRRRINITLLVMPQILPGYQLPRKDVFITFTALE